MSHTPGPWVTFYTADDGFLILPAMRRGEIAAVALIASDDAKEIEANAQLITAAPDLLEALKAMVDRWEPDCSGQDRIMWENACAAIEKATTPPPPGICHEGIER